MMHKIEHKVASEAKHHPARFAATVGGIAGFSRATGGNMVAQKRTGKPKHLPVLNAAVGAGLGYGQFKARQKLQKRWSKFK